LSLKRFYFEIAKSFGFVNKISYHLFTSLKEDIYYKEEYDADIAVAVSNVEMSFLRRGHIGAV